VKSHTDIEILRVDVVVTIAFYFVTHLKDPGYVPHDAVFYTENDDVIIYEFFLITRRKIKNPN